MTRDRPYRLLSIGHSYCVALNRRLPNEIALAGRGDWTVTAVAPSYFHGDLREINFEEDPNEMCAIEKIDTFLDRWIHYFVYSPRLRAILARGWDLVHCWEEPYTFAGGQIAYWTPIGIPLVFWSGQSTFKWYPPPFAQIERYCLRRAAGWMARGESGAETLLRRGYGSKPYRVMPLGVDTRTFRPDLAARSVIHQQLSWHSEGPPVIGYLGRFVKEKGVRLLTRVLAGLNTPWRALFVGGGPLESMLRAWAAPYGESVRIVTGVPHKRVPAYLNAMDVLCAPSRTTLAWREIFGRMIIEAFACGVPVIASNCGEIPNVVRDAGIVVGEDDEHRFREAVDLLLRNPASRAELSARGIERALSVYAWPVIAASHIDFFSELIERNRHANAA